MLNSERGKAGWVFASLLALLLLAAGLISYGYDQGNQKAEEYKSAWENSQEVSKLLAEANKANAEAMKALSDSNNSLTTAVLENQKKQDRVLAVLWIGCGLLLLVILCLAFVILRDKLQGSESAARTRKVRS